MSTTLTAATTAGVTDRATLTALEAGMRMRDAAKARFDAALVRFDAWFLVFVAVVLALGVTIAAGLAVWCVVKQRKTFTGHWSFRNFGLQVYFECR